MNEVTTAIPGITIHERGPNTNIVAPSAPASSAFSTPHTTKLAAMASTKHMAVMMIDSE